MTRRFVVLLCVLSPWLGTQGVFAGTGDPAVAQMRDPAVAQIQTLTAALLKSMKAGRGQSMTERYRNLEPVIQQSFALQQMTRITVGPQAWAQFTPQQQQQSIAAFSRFITANYAYNFREYDGERFDVDSNPRSRGDDKLVQTHIIGRDGDSTSLLYRMRQADGSWKILDVYSDGVSELTLRRSDFSAAIAAGGAPELLSYLQKASDGLMRR